MPPFSEFPVNLRDIDPKVVRLLHQAASSGAKADADAARKSTFPFLQAEDFAEVQRYSPVYAAAQILYAHACLAEAMTSEAEPPGKSDLVAECFRAIDLALLRAGMDRWRSIVGPLLLRAQDVADEIESVGDSNPPAADSLETNSISTPPQWVHGSPLLSDIPRVDSMDLSVDQFLTLFMEPSRDTTEDCHPQPVIIKHGMAAWTALKRWQDVSYLKRVAASRLVPVETYDTSDATQTYLTDSWEQQVMSVGDFIDRYVLRDETNNAANNLPMDAGYLAQHPLFDQIPALRKDIEVPQYCTAMTSADIHAPESVECLREPLVSAWLGPCGTVSPLHNDPYHNILCQVVGSKYLRLYSLRETDHLYAREGPICNNSYVDIDNVDDAQYPLFRRAQGWQCVLRAGEMLYIPRHYWHYVRSLERSFSVSFW